MENNKQIKLNEINFDTPIDLIINNNKIPLKFQHCSFDNYIPNEDYPSQKEIKEKLIEFVRMLEEYNKKVCCEGVIKKFLRKNSKPKAIYLDGGFGVGKTHLLCSIGNTYKGKSVFVSFSELMYLIAYFNLLPLVEKMSEFDVVLLDEFELDDPGDAMMGINFIREISKTDTVVVTTSNTTPVALGGRKFDIMVFKERIGKLVDYFQTYAIDGKDYRVTKAPKIEYESSKQSLKSLFDNYETKNRKKLYVQFDELLKKMRDIHPVRYINFNENVDAIFIEDLRKFTDDEMLDALRFTYLIDILYYGAVDIYISTDIHLWDMFSDDLKDGKFKNKIMRCLSRVSEKGVFVNTKI
jgi:cell division protein ZapE